MRLRCRLGLHEHAEESRHRWIDRQTWGGEYVGEDKYTLFLLRCTHCGDVRTRRLRGHW